MQKTKISFLVALIFGILLLSSPLLAIKADVKEPKADPLNVAFITGTGGLGDQSFNDLGYAGCMMAKEEGLCTFVMSEPDEISEFEGLQENYASNDSIDLIVTLGYDQASAVNKTAKAHPEVPIVLIDMVVVQGKVRSVTFKAGEGSFLVGAMAGLMTEAGKIGFIGGKDDFLIEEFYAGFAAGIVHATRNYTENADPTILKNFVGDWSDPAKGKSLAEGVIAEGADVIYAAAGLSGLGVIEAVNETDEDVWLIGVDADQDHLIPGKVLTSMVKRVDLAVYQAIKDLYDDKWTADIQTLGLKENAVGISALKYTKDDIGTANIKIVNETIRGHILDGTLEVPTTYEDLCDLYNVCPATAPGFELLFVLGALALVPILLRRKK
ncbi:MAG: BMP family protein [Promethearchaeota archaeon]